MVEYESIDRANVASAFDRALHESGHAIVALNLGCNVSSITISGATAEFINRQNGTLLPNKIYGGNFSWDYPPSDLDEKAKCFIAISIGWGSNAAMRYHYRINNMIWSTHLDHQFSGDKEAIDNNIVRLGYVPDVVFTKQAKRFAAHSIVKNRYSLYAIAHHLSINETLNGECIEKIWNMTATARYIG